VGRDKPQGRDKPHLFQLNRNGIKLKDGKSKRAKEYC
jgi:hypothetical protein